MKKAELLAPAGNMEKFKMALHYGADAVFMGGKMFNLRAGSNNFSDEELEEAVNYAHERGKRVYVTLNIIPHNDELDALPDYVKFLERIGVDVKVRNSGIKIDGTFEAGNKIDNLENNKGHNFPTFDIVIDENGKKTAISTKSLDLTSKSYTSKEYKNQMYYNIKGYIDDIDNFKKAGKGKDVLTKKMISKNVLEISINEYELTKQQIDNRKIGGKMDVIVRISKEKKIEDFRMVIIPSGRSEIGLIRAKNYGIIAYPNKKDFEKIGEMIYWGFNESDDKVIEN